MKKAVILIATILCMVLLWGCVGQNSTVTTSVAASVQDTRNMSDEEVLVEACKYAKAQYLDHQLFPPSDRAYIVFTLTAKLKWKKDIKSIKHMI